LELRYNADFSVHVVADELADVEAESHAVRILPLVFFQHTEGLEQFFLILFADPKPSVKHLDLQKLSKFMVTNSHSDAAFLRKLECIGQIVPEHLLYSDPVRLDELRQRVRVTALEFELLDFRIHFEHVKDFVDGSPHVEDLLGDSESSFPDLSKVEEVVDLAEQHLARHRDYLVQLHFPFSLLAHR